MLQLFDSQTFFSGLLVLLASMVVDLSELSSKGSGQRLEGVLLLIHCLSNFVLVAGRQTEKC